MKFLKRSYLLAGALMFTASTFSFAAMEAGDVKVYRLKGKAEVRDESTGEQRILQTNDIFSQGHTVITSNDSSVYLLLSNGSAVNLAANSSLSITTFTQEPFNGARGRFNVIRGDPSVSDTILTLNYGDVVGRVKNLKDQSNYQVASPVGTANIRGTTWRVSFREGEGTLIMEIENVDGDVDAVTAEAGAEFQDVASGTIFEIRVQAGEYEVITGRLSGSQMAAIQAAIQLVPGIGLEVGEGIEEEPPLQIIEVLLPDTTDPRVIDTTLISPDGSS